MADSIPEVLTRLARSGVSVRWRNGRAVFSAAAEPPADIIALIDARKAEVSAFLHPEAVRRRAPDFALVYFERLKLSGLDANDEEVRLRAFEHTVGVCRTHHRVDLETAKRMTADAIKQARTKEPATP
jgi:hypothetical protein